MKTVEEYAIGMVAAGAESVIEDDLNEDDEVTEDDHKLAIKLAYGMVEAIRDHPGVLIAMARGEQISEITGQLSIQDMASVLDMGQHIRLEVARILTEHGVDLVGVSGDDWSVKSLTRDVLHLAAAIETGAEPTPPQDDDEADTFASLMPPSVD